MRDSYQVLDFIDWLIGNWLKSPESYAGDSAALEHMFIVLDQLRAFILDEYPDRVTSEIGYFTFLREQGYQASDFCTGKPPVAPQKAPSRESFQPLCGFLRQYLDSKFRTKRDGEGTAWTPEPTG